MLKSFSSLTRSSDITSLLDKSSQHYTAVVFESNNSYVGREVVYELCMNMNESNQNTADIFLCVLLNQATKFD